MRAAFKPSSRIVRGLATWALVGLVAGCTPPRPSPPAPPPHAKVNVQAVANKHLKHYAIAPSQSIITPDPAPENPPPAYPPDLVARKLPPVTVTALLIVDSKGHVRDVRIAGAAGDDPLQRQFDAAVRSATLHWRFTPLRIANWVTDANGDARRVGSIAKPFSQTYRFRFEVHDGKPRVSGAVPASQR